MGSLSAGMFIGIFAGIVGGVLGPLLLVLLLPRKKCPDCEAPLSKMRNCWNIPGVVRRCRECGCGVDIKGRKVEKRRGKKKVKERQKESDSVV
jgi:hypothetical protein